MNQRYDYVAPGTYGRPSDRAIFIDVPELVAFDHCTDVIRTEDDRQMFARVILAEMRARGDRGLLVAKVNGVAGVRKPVH